MAEPAIPPAVAPVAAAPGLPAGSGKKSSYKLLIIVGAIVLVVVVFVMLFMRNRSRKLREELERQRRQEMHNQSELEAQRIAEAYYAQSYPAGLYYDQQQQPNQAQQPDATAPVHPPTAAVPAPMPDATAAGHCADGVCYPPKQVPKPQPAMPPAPTAPRQTLVPSPAGTVRELPDEPGSPPPRPPAQQQPAAPPVVDPFLMPVEQPEPPVKPASPQPPPVRSPMLQQSFRIDPIVSSDPFAPIVPPIPAELESLPTISTDTAADDDQPPPLVETGLTMD